MTIETTRPTRVQALPSGKSSAGPKPPAPTRVVATPRCEPSGRDRTPPQAADRTTPTFESPAGSQTGRDQSLTGAQRTGVSATSIPGDQVRGDAQPLPVAGEHDQPTAIGDSLPIGQAPSAADDPRTAIGATEPKQLPPSGGAEPGPPATTGGPSPNGIASLADPFLALAADVLDDLEKVRIANENRLRQLLRGGRDDPRLKGNGGKYESVDDLPADKDGEERGFGLDHSHLDAARLAALVDALGKTEHQATLNLQRVMREHPLGPWVKATAGVGEKQAARLLASIGDPYWNSLHDRPRTVSELWAYCGYHVLPARQRIDDAHSGIAGGSKTGHPDHMRSGGQDALVGVAPKRQRGARANWSSAAKMRTYLIAESCIKLRTSPFRPVYDDARAKYADAVHDVPCPRCGPSGKPAPAGSPLSDGHKHARAMRAVSKAVLKALWREAKRIHEQPGGQSHGDAQSASAAGSQLQEDEL